MGIRIRTVDQLYILPDIHTEFTHNFWVSALWETVLPGKTLVDIIAGIFTGVATALQTVKKGLSKAWAGIRSAGSYISSTLLGPIVNTMKSLFSYSLDALFEVLSTVSSGVSSSSGDQKSLTILGINIQTDILVSNLSIDFLFNGTRVLGYSPFPEFETLGVDDPYLGSFVTSVLGLILHLNAIALYAGSQGLRSWSALGLFSVGAVLGSAGVVMALSYAMQHPDSTTTRSDWRTIVAIFLSYFIMAIFVIEILNDWKDLKTTTAKKYLKLGAGIIAGMATGLFVIPDLDEQAREEFGFIISTLIANFVVLLTTALLFNSLKPLDWVFYLLIIVFGILYFALGGALEFWDKLR